MARFMGNPASDDADLLLQQSIDHVVLQLVPRIGL